MHRDRHTPPPQASGPVADADADLRDWCGTALGAAAELPAAEPWAVRLFGVVDPADVRGDPKRAARSLHRALAGMQTPAGEPLAQWTNDSMQLLTGTLTPPTDDADPTTGPARAPRTAPTLIAGTAALTDLPTQVLGLTAKPPLLGLVAVIRGYVSTTSVTETGDRAARAAAQDVAVWSAGGDRWPGELDPADGQAAVGAFAFDRRSGDTAMLAQRVPGPGQHLTDTERARIVDLTRAAPLTFTTLTDSPWVVLALACGRRDVVPEHLRPALPRAPWLTGRFMLHEAYQHTLAWLEGAALDPPHLPPAPLPPSASWGDVRRDQLGRRQLGALLTAAQARLLPELLLAEECLSRSPSQRWLWAQLTELLAQGSDGQRALEAMREQWQRHEPLHEPEHYVGAAATSLR